MTNAIHHPLGAHAVVIGGSMAGLLAARVLSNHFATVTILERDPVHDAPETRKGQPHTRHLHALLAKGLEIMNAYFPGLDESLVAHGALVDDMGSQMRWHVEGGYRLQTWSDLKGALSSRPLLEWQVRRRVLALPNVQLVDACDVEHLVFTDDKRRVTGVQATNRTASGASQRYPADLVIDASGRGSGMVRWLEQAGYLRPQEELVKIDMGYATRLYRRRPQDLPGANLVMIASTPPHGARGGMIFPVEDDRWICTLTGTGGDHAPTDPQAFLDFARSLAAPDIYDLLGKLEPVSDILAYKFSGSLRRRYERLSRFPGGYLVIGDALCSFNPIFGQGMTVAALEAQVLDRLLAAARGRSPETLWRRFFAEAAKVVDIPWQMAVGQDFRFPTTQGRQAPQTGLVNRYIARVNRATHTDPVVYLEFLKVMNLMQPPSSLFHPRILRRVLGQASAVTERRALQPLPY